MPPLILDPGPLDHPFRRDMLLGKPCLILTNLRLVHKLPAFQQKNRSGDLVQDLGPDRDDLLVHLDQVVERAERDLPLLQNWRRPRIRGNGEGRVAEKSVGQTDQGLSVILVRNPFWISNRVGEAVIHDRHSGGVRVSQPSELNRRRLPHKDQQAVLRGVSGHIHQDIDPILPNLGRDVVIPFSLDDMPVVGEFLDAFRHLIRLLQFGITEDLQLFLVVGLEERFKEIRTGVIPEIWGDITDPEPSIRIPVVRVGEDLVPERLAIERVPPEMLLKHLIQGPGLILQGEQEIAKRLRVIRLDREHLSVAGDRLIHPALLAQRAPQVMVVDRILRIQTDRLADLINRDIMPINLERDDPVQVHGIRMIWLYRENLLIDILSLAQFPGFVMLERGLEGRVDVEGGSGEGRWGSGERRERRCRFLGHGRLEGRDGAFCLPMFALFCTPFPPHHLIGIFNGFRE